MNIYDCAKTIVITALINGTPKSDAVTQVGHVLSEDGTSSEVAHMYAEQYVKRLTKDIIW